MSYCVHCGVELDPSAGKCALCSTPVIDPNIQPEPVVSEKPFADRVLIPKNIQRKFIAYVITMIMLIPNIVLFLVNLFFYRSGFWSIYFLSTTLLAWVLFVFPFFTNKLKPYLMWAFDTAAVCAYVFVFFALGGKKPTLFLSLLVVIILLSVAALIMLFWLRRKKRHWTAVMVHGFTDLFFVSLIAGFLIALINKNPSFFYSGLICSVSSLAIVGFFIYCNRSRRVRAWLNKAFYI